MGPVTQRNGVRAEPEIDRADSAADASKRRPYVLFVNRSYWPDAEATGQLLTELCEDLSSEFEVSVLVGQPNQNPQGDRYRRFRGQQRNGVNVIRVPHLRLSKAWPLGRVLNWISFLIAAWLRSLFLPRPAAVVVESDPFLLPLLGWWMRLWHGSRLVIYLQDIYPDIAIALGKVRATWWVRRLRALLFSIHRSAERVVVLSRDMKILLIEAGVADARIVRIPNWTDTTQIVPVKERNRFRAAFDLNERFVVMHSGNMGLSQRLEVVLAAAEQLRHRRDIVFLLVGDGAARRSLQRIAQERNLANVRFLPYQPKTELAQSLSAADVQLISTDANAIRCLMPSKLYGILASGTPVLAAVPQETELAEVVRESGAGRVVTPDSPESLAEAILWCAAHPAECRQMGSAARELAERRFDRRHAVAQFQNLLQSVLRERLLTEAVPDPHEAREPLVSAS